MTWASFGTTALFMVIGYLIGSTSFAIIISKFLKKEDIRSKGSGNAGATNALRNYGARVGLTVFILDICKPILAVSIAFIFKNNFDGGWAMTILPAVGFAAVIGHVWPIYFKFQGGKGSACFLGFFICMQWMLAIFGFIIFMIIVWKTRKVSLGSIITPIILIYIQIILGATGSLQGAWSVPLMRDHWYVNSIFLTLIWLLTVYKHKANIYRLMNGVERSLGSK